MTDILVVDDDADILEFMAAALRRAAYTVSTAEGGWEALAQVKARAGKAPFHLIATDVRMLKGDGIELLEGVQAQPAPADRTPVLLVSGYDVGSAEVLDRGAVGLLTKPFQTDELVSQVRRALQPVETRWSTPPAWAEDAPELGARFPSLAAAQAAADLSIGRGGFAASADVELPEPGELVRFRIDFADGSAAFAGAGICRWARAAARHGFVPGYGVEFEYLEPHALALVLALLTRQAPRAYVPFGHAVP